MNAHSERELLDDRLEAMGRLERRRLLLQLSVADQHDEPRIDFSELKRGAGDLDPLVTMRHLHLPVLEERQFIRWDRENHWITKGSRFDEIEPFLKLLRELRDDVLDRRRG